MVKKIRPLGHGFLAYAAALRYGFPASKMVVFGITGTAGKSTTVQMLSKIMNESGRKTGYSTTVSYFDGETEYINPDGMSMAGRFRLQGYLRAMVENGCQYAIVEATSEGLVQNRHLGTNFDICAITTLAPAHVEAHGGFENYKRAKGKLFSSLSRSKRKKFFPHKYIGANLDNEFSDYFLSFPADKKFGTTLYKDTPEIALEHVQKNLALVSSIYAVENLQIAGEQLAFKISGQEFTLHVPGKFNAYNAAMAVACANSAGVPLDQCARGIAAFTGIAGRMERIPSDKLFQVYLDYGAAPISMQNALEAISALPHQRIIHAFGAPGGHRDVSQRFEFGRISAHFADVIIIMNEDVYESDESEIGRNIEQGIRRVPADERRVKDVRTVLDRREGIRTALELAQPGDLVIITGKGIEQFLVLPGNKRIAWDDKKVIQDFLKE